MESGLRTSVWEPFATLTDPRRDHLQEHRLVDSITIALCGVIRGAEGWAAIETFGREKEGWLARPCRWATCSRTRPPTPGMDGTNSAAVEPSTTRPISPTFHWVLDVTFHEDASRVSVGHAPETFAILRYLALNLLRQDRSSTGSVPTKRFRAALNDRYLRSILTGLST